MRALVRRTKQFVAEFGAPPRGKGQGEGGRGKGTGGRGKGGRGKGT